MSKAVGGINGAFEMQTIGTEEEKSARAVGYIDGVTACGESVPMEVLLDNGGRKAYEWMIDHMKSREIKRQEELAAVAEHELEDLYTDPDATGNVLQSCRSALMNVSLMDTDGFCHNENGKLAEDTHYQTIAGVSIPEWGNSIIEFDGNEINEGDFSKLPDQDKALCVSTPYFYLATESGSSQITIDKRVYIERLVKKDMLEHPGVARRFACEIGINADQSRGKLYAYRRTVIDTLKKVEPLVYSGTLIKQLHKGFITTSGQLNIAILERVAAISQPSLLPELGPDRLEWCLTLMEAFNNRSKIDKFFPQADRLVYREEDGNGLPAMKYENGHYARLKSDKTNDDGYVTYLESLIMTLGSNMNEAFVLSKKGNATLDQASMKRLLAISAKFYP